MSSEVSILILCVAFIIVCGISCASLTWQIAHAPKWTEQSFYNASLTDALTIIKSDPGSASWPVVVLRSGSNLSIPNDPAAMYLTVDSENMVVGLYHGNTVATLPTAGIVATY